MSICKSRFWRPRKSSSADPAAQLSTCCWCLSAARAGDPSVRTFDPPLRFHSGQARRTPFGLASRQRASGRKVRAGSTLRYDPSTKLPSIRHGGLRVYASLRQDEPVASDQPSDGRRGDLWRASGQESQNRVSRARPRDACGRRGCQEVMVSARFSGKPTTRPGGLGDRAAPHFQDGRLSFPIRPCDRSRL
jgi:hypothetical protein